MVFGRDFASDGLMTQAAIFDGLAAHFGHGAALPFDFAVVDEAQDVGITPSSDFLRRLAAGAATVSSLLGEPVNDNDKDGLDKLCLAPGQWQKAATTVPASSHRHSFAFLATMLRSQRPLRRYSQFQ
jgi:hypothetical protein